MDVAVPFGTDQTFIPIRFRISLDLPDAVVLYKGEDAATVPTAVAESWDPGDRRLRACLGPAPKIQELITQGQSTRAHSRPLQKSPSRNHGPIIIP
jgi:hypothetical protein